MRSDDEIRADVRIADGNNYERYEQDAADGRLVGDVPDLLAEVVRLRAAVDAVKALAVPPAGSVIDAANRVADEYGVSRDVGHIFVPAILGPVRAALAGAEQEAGTG